MPSSCFPTSFLRRNEKCFSTLIRLRPHDVCHVWIRTRSKHTGNVNNTCKIRGVWPRVSSHRLFSVKSLNFTISLLREVVYAKRSFRPRKRNLRVLWLQSFYNSYHNVRIVYNAIQFWKSFSHLIWFLGHFSRFVRFHGGFINSRILKITNKPTKLYIFKGSKVLK